MARTHDGTWRLTADAVHVQRGARINHGVTSGYVDPSRTDIGDRTSFAVKGSDPMIKKVKPYVATTAADFMQTRKERRAANRW